MTRQADAPHRVPAGRSRVGERFEVEVGPIAHGGHCVARLDGTPTTRAAWSSCGTRSRASGSVVEITEGTEGDRFWRGDAVEVPRAVAGPGRGALPVRRAGPVRRLRLPARRAGRASASSRPTSSASSCAGWPGSTWTSIVEAVPGDEDGLRWRTRHAVRRAARTAGRGMRKHRSHDVVPGRRLPDRSARRPSRAGRRASRRGDRRTSFAVAGDGFWQVHPGAPRAWSRRCSTCSRPQPGEPVLDLYAGVGLFAGVPRRRGRPGRRGGRGRGRPHAPADARPRQPRPRGGPRSSDGRRRPGAGRRRTTSRSTSSSSTRPARAPGARSWSRSSTAPRAPSRTSPATRPPWPATSRSSPSTATRSSGCEPSTCSR